MNSQDVQSFPILRKFVPLGAGLFALLTGCLVLVGWAFDLNTLKTILPGANSMKPNTAVALVLAGLSLSLLSDQAATEAPTQKKNRKRIGQVCALFIALLGLLTLGEYISGWDFHIDELLFRDDSPATAVFSPGRMAQPTALNFVLLACSLLLLSTNLKQAERVGSPLALVAAFISLLAILGYAYNVPSFYRITSFSSIALHTAIALFVLCVGILVALESRRAGIGILRNTIGGKLARRLLPAALLVPFVAGWFRLQGERAGYYSTEFGLSLFATTNIVILMFLIWLTARSIDRTDAERKQAENTLRESEARLRRLFEQASDGIFIISPDNQYLAANARGLEMLGYTEQELMQMHVADVLVAGERKRLETEPVLMMAGQPHLAEWEHLRKDGTTFVGEVSARRLNDDSYLAIVRDLTERRQVEAALRESEARLNEAQRNALIGSWRYLADGTLIWSDQMYELFKLSRDVPPTHEAVMTVIHPEDRTVSFDLPFQRALESGAADFKSEYRVIWPDDQVRTFYSHGKVRRQETGELIEAVGTVQDVTERKRAENELVKNQQLLQAIVDNSPAHVYVKDLEGRFLLVNRGLAELFNRSKEEISGKTTHDLVAKEDADRHRANDLEVLRSGKPVVREESNQESDGVHTYYSVKFPLIGEDLKPYALGGISTDITEKKRAEEAALSEKLFSDTAIDVLPGIVCLYDERGHFLRWNKNFEKVSGYSAAEIALMHPLDFFAGEDKELLQRRIGEVFVEGESSVEASFVARDGTATPFFLMGKRIVLDQGPCFIGVGIDITERKRADEQILQSREQLRALTAHLQDIREEERTRIAREVHDVLGQLLTALKIDIRMFAKKLSDYETAEGRINLTKRINTMQELTDEVIKTVQQISSELRPGVLDSLGLVAAVEWQAREFERRTDIACLCDLPASAIEISPARATALFRIFQEILTNVARHAAATLVIIKLYLENGEAVLKVSDNGRGITPEQLRAASSLGLLGMQERTRLLGGAVSVTGELGVGTEVEARLPIEPE